MSASRFTSLTTDIPDIQSHQDDRRISIDQVGIKSLRYPIVISRHNGQPQHTVARIDMYVNLPAAHKGTHMSRFVALLNENQNPIDASSFCGLLQTMNRRLDTDHGHICMEFPFFLRKQAPVTGMESLMDYDVSLIGDCTGNDCRISLKVLVPVTSLCPCSRDISDYGAHNQRSHIILTAHLREPLREPLWIEGLIRIAESEASCELFGLLKRPDEKFVTERAYDNPKFVEDVVRDLATRLDADNRIQAYVVECENFESIHNHSAYARIERVKDAPRQQDPDHGNLRTLTGKPAHSAASN